MTSTGSSAMRSVSAVHCVRALGAPQAGSAVRRPVVGSAFWRSTGWAQAQADSYLARKTTACTSLQPLEKTSQTLRAGTIIRARSVPGTS
eukprot:523124-Rhodomonas_salina.4